MKSPGDFVAGNYYLKYTSQNPLVRLFVGSFIQTLIELLGRVEAEDCLDIGTGEGLLLSKVVRAYPQRRFYASDVDFGVQKDAYQRVGVPSLVSSATAIPIASETFDLVIACEVLEHLSDAKMAVREIRRVTRRYALFSVPREPLWRLLNIARGTYLRDLGNTPGHLQHWSSNAFVAMICREFQVLAVRKPVPWTFVLCQT
jgi:ubiquinone/menaquinone biosynthesis C-methylase UbiE